MLTPVCMAISPSCVKIVPKPPSKTLPILLRLTPPPTKPSPITWPKSAKVLAIPLWIMLFAFWLNSFKIFSFSLKSAFTGCAAPCSAFFTVSFRFAAADANFSCASGVRPNISTSWSGVYMGVASSALRDFSIASLIGFTITSSPSNSSPAWLKPEIVKLFKMFSKSLSLS